MKKKHKTCRWTYHNQELVAGEAVTGLMMIVLGMFFFIRGGWPLLLLLALIIVIFLG